VEKGQRLIKWKNNFCSQIQFLKVRISQSTYERITSVHQCSCWAGLANCICCCFIAIWSLEPSEMHSAKTAARFYSIAERFSWEEVRSRFPASSCCSLGAYPFLTLPWWCLAVSKDSSLVPLIHFLPNYVSTVSGKQTSSVKHCFYFRKKKGEQMDLRKTEANPYACLLFPETHCSLGLVTLCWPVFRTTAFPALPWKAFFVDQSFSFKDVGCQKPDLYFSWR